MTWMLRRPAERFRKSRRLPQGRETGAALVEAAVLFLPLCIILFGIMEFGFVYKDSLTLSSATRSGARTGSALTGTVSEAFFPAVVNSVEKSASAASFSSQDQIWIYKTNALGKPLGDESCGGGSGTATCIVYTFTPGVGWKHIGTTFLWDPTTANTCLGNGEMDSLGVRLTLHRSSITGMFPMLDNMVLKEKSIMSFEPTSSMLNGCG